MTDGGETLYQGCCYENNKGGFAMWDLNSLQKINQKAVELAKDKKPEREALFVVTKVKDGTPSLKKEAA